MPYPAVAITDAPYAVAPATVQMGYFGAIKKTPVLSAKLQALKAKLAARKAARCAKRQQRLQTACANHAQRLSMRHLRPRTMARLSAALSRQCAKKQAALTKRCATAPVISFSAGTPVDQSTDDQNIVDAADLASAMDDWNSCMADEKTCATDDCGLQSDCNDPDKDYQKQCISDWKDCMAGDATCATDYCGTKPVAGLSGLGDFDSSKNVLLFMAGAALLWYFLSKKKG